MSDAMQPRYVSWRMTFGRMLVTIARYARTQAQGNAAGDLARMPVGSAVEVVRVTHGEPVPDGFRANPPAKTRAHHDRYGVSAVRAVGPRKPVSVVGE